MKLDEEGDWSPALQIGVQILLESGGYGGCVVITHAW